MGGDHHVLVVAIVVLTALGTAAIPVAQAQPAASQDDACQAEPESLAVENAYDSAQRATFGATAFSDSSNYTTFDTADETAFVETTADSGRGLGAVGELGSVTFSRSWTAPCTGVYTFTVVYDTEITAEHHREASQFGNGVTKGEVKSRLLVGNTTETATWETVGRTNETEWTSMIPRLADLKDDALVNYFSAAVDEVLGVPVGEPVAEGVGIERNATELQRSVSDTDQRISVTFHANEGDEIDFLHQVEAAVIAASIANGDSTGHVAVEVDVQEATVASADDSPADDGDEDGVGPETGAEATFAVMSTTPDAEFGYRFTVDGTVEKTTTADGTAADDDDRILEHENGTTTVVGSTGDQFGDAYLVEGQVTSYEKTGGESLYRLYLDDREVTEELTAGSTVEIVSTDRDAELAYEFRVDGDAERMVSENGHAGDRSDHVIRNDDGTVTVRGTTGDRYGDAFAVEGEIVSFEKTGGDSGFRLLVDGRDVTDEYTEAS